MVVLEEIIKYGSIASLFGFALLLFLAYNSQKRALEQMRLLKSKLDRMAALVEALVEEKKVISAHAKHTVDKSALHAVLEQTAASLRKAMMLEVVQVARRR